MQEHITLELLGFDKALARVTSHRLFTARAVVHTPVLRPIFGRVSNQFRWEISRFGSCLASQVLSR